MRKDITKNSLQILAALAATSIALSGCVGVSVTAQERPFDRAFTDFRARTDLNARMLAEDPRMFANVSTTVIEGRAHLAGSVDSETQKERATQLAWAAPGITEVVNNIEVNGASGIVETVDDRWISGQVRARILADSSIRDSNYQIDTQNNVVYIMGIAQDAQELDKVLRHAAVVRGVRQVVNYAVLKDDPRRAAAVPTADFIRPAAVNDKPPVLSDDRAQGYAAQSAGAPSSGYLPKPVEVEALPTDPSKATGAPRSLIR